jgi:hypothetical protein
VHTDTKVEAGMSHLTKLFLQDKKRGKRLFGRHKFMGPLAVATISDREGVLELLIPNSTRCNVLYKRNDHMGEADSLLNWTPIAKSEVGNEEDSTTTDLRFWPLDGVRYRMARWPRAMPRGKGEARQNIT